MNHSTNSEEKLEHVNKYYWTTNNKRQLLVIYTVLSIVWIACSYLLLYSPISNMKNIKYKLLATSIFTIPLFVFANNIYKNIKSEDLADIPTDFSICMTGEQNLTEEERNFGAIGKINYACLRNQYDMLNREALSIQNQSYYLIYSLFTLILLLFTIKRTKSIIRSEDNFIKNAIMLSMMLSVVNMIAPIYSEYGWYSISLNAVSNAIFKMNVITVISLVTYIGYKLM